tara:strand:+ start:4191 stop:5036 length:846 start_codon:yes stop_codon:yes gene_type:complete
MKKLLLILLFLPMVGFGKMLINCSSLKALNFDVDNMNLIVDISISNTDSLGLQYPFIAYTLDYSGDTIQSGNINLFGTMGLDTTVYSYSLSSQVNPIYPLSIFLVHTNFGVNDTCILNYHPSCDSVITTFAYIDSSINPNQINLNVQTLGLNSNGFGYGGFILLNLTGDTIAFENINTAGNVFGLLQCNLENRMLELVQNIFFPFNGSLHLVSGWFSGNPTTSCIYNLNISEISTAIADKNFKKNVMKITGYLGKQTSFKKNTPLIYIFDDGTVEKKITID